MIETYEDENFNFTRIGKNLAIDSTSPFNYLVTNRNNTHVTVVTLPFDLESYKQNILIL